MKKYDVSYRGEFIVIVEAENEEEAIKKAEQSNQWSMITEGHTDMYEVEEAE